MLFITSNTPVDGKTVLLDIETGSVHRTYKSDPSPHGAATCYSRATESIFVPQDKPCLYQFSPAMQQPVQRSFTAEKIRAAATSPCGNFLVGGSAESGCVYIWNILTGELLRLMKVHLRFVSCVSFSADGSLFATGSEDITCKVWSLGTVLSSTQSSPSADVTFTAHSLGITCCSFLHFSLHVVTGSLDRTIRMFDACSGVLTFTVTLDVPPSVVTLHPSDCSMVVGAQQGVLFFIKLYKDEDLNDTVSKPSVAKDATWEPELRTRSRVTEGHSAAIRFVQYDAAKPTHVLVASEDGLVLIWDTVSLRVVRQVANIRKGLSSVVGASHLTVDSIGTKKYDLCTVLGKYPVDPNSDVGYQVPLFGAGAPTEGTLPGTNIPNVKYNKAKQKRLREEMAVLAEAEASSKAREDAASAAHTEQMTQMQQQLTDLKEMAAKMEAKLASVEAKRQQRKN